MVATTSVAPNGPIRLKVLAGSGSNPVSGRTTLPKRRSDVDWTQQRGTRTYETSCINFGGERSLGTDAENRLGTWFAARSRLRDYPKGRGSSTGPGSDYDSGSDSGGTTRACCACCEGRACGCGHDERTRSDCHHCWDGGAARRERDDS